MKIKDIKSVTIFGDSVTKGVVTSSEGKISVIKDNAVNIAANHYGVEVNNVSFYGQTIKRIDDRGLIDTYLSKIDSKNSDENIVFVAIGGNDCDRYWKDIAKYPTEKHYPKTKLNDFVSMLEKTVDKIRNYNCLPILCTIPPINADRYFNNVICKISDGNEIIKYLNGEVANISRAQDCYNIAVVKTAMGKDCLLVDVRSALLYDRIYDDYLCYDGIHPNAEGQRLIGDTIILQLNKFFN